MQTKSLRIQLILLVVSNKNIQSLKFHFPYCQIIKKKNSYRQWTL